ncbi:MAG: T9SS C-terminal target domain-containing protein [Bacteroidetes bacterium]|nr:MAG: T9SS C-terminal target domain-containing protein [Bacteroidota bacterium]
MHQKVHFLFALLAFLFVLPGAKAQYTTPGNNLSLTLQDLVGMSGGVVTETDGDFFINSTLTIASSDTLKISEPETIRTAATVRIEIMGKFISDPAEGMVVFTAQDTTSSAANFRGFRFEDADPAVFRNTVVKYGGGIQLIATEALFEHCIMRNNGHSNVSAAITYSNSSPVIRYSEFRENSRSALASGANVLGSPQIMFSSFIHNTTENSNRPQINLGPGAADTIKIVGNYVEGLYTVVGGIAVSNLLGGGSSKVLIADNVIVNNRYGYAQTGNNISSVIRGNTILDNDIQGNPMQGGSGLNFNGITNNHATVRGNLVSGNLWGVTIQNTAQPNFGDADDQGGNVFFDNGNNNQIFALYNNTPNPINAIGNYWGGNTDEEAELYIIHFPNDTLLGLVTYLPIMQLHPHVNSFAFRANDNEGLQEDLVGIIDSENYLITVFVDAETDITQLIPDFSVALGVFVSPDSNEPQDFTQDVEYTLSVPHGDEQVWTVTLVTEEPDLFSVIFQVADENQTSIDNAVITLNGDTNDAGDYVFEGLMPGTYNYSVAAPGFIPAEGTVEITDEDVDVEITLTLLTYQLTFVITDEDGAAVEDAVISLDDQEYPAGEYVFEGLLPGTYDYAVAADGYETVVGSVEVVDEDVEESVVLTWLRYTLTFVVTDEQGVEVENAVIVLDGQVYGQGMYVFEDMLPGIYDYTVEAEGYHTVAGAAEIVDEDVEVLIELVIIVSVNEWDYNAFSLYPNPASHYVILHNSADGAAEILVTDLNGSIVIQTRMGSGEKQLNVEDLKEGIYIIRVVAGDTIVVRKLSVVR